MGQIQLKYGSQSAVPTGLLDGEFAINLDTNQLYYGSGSAVLSDLRLNKVTAETYVISSSVTHMTTSFSSGSTEFGDTADDSHTFTGNITASGNISASGNIITDQLLLNDGNKIIGHHGTDGFQIRSQNSDPIVFKTNGNNIRATISSTGEATFTNVVNATKLNTGQGDNELHAMNQDVETTDNVLFNNITASGNISSSGTIFTDGISSPSNNLTISSSTVKITATTDGEANLILESDSDNNDENDNPFMLFTQDGGAINGYMGLTGDADKWPDGGTLTGATANALVLGTKGPTTSTNSQLFLVAGDSASLRIANDADIHMYENLNVAKTIAVDGQLALNNVNGAITLGYHNTYPINIGKNTNPIGIYGNITASSNISASGTITGTSFNAQTSITASGDISASGNLTADRLYLDASSGTYLHHSSGTSIGTNGTLTAGQNISATGTILAGWHGSTTRIKILVSDFIPDDIGRPAMIDDSGSDRWLESHGTAKLFASLPIPTGFKATHVHIYGSATSALEVSEMNINSKSVTSKGTGNIGTELNITDVTSTATNYLLLELAQASGEEVYGGYVTIAAV